MKNLLAILASFICLAAYSQIPESIKGNWVNEKSNEWEYGFFENFAIYNCDFWDYNSIKVKGKQINITLTNKDRRTNIDIFLKNDTTLQIKNGKRKETFHLVNKVYPAYKTKDTTEFPEPTFHSGTVTLIGYYHNFYNIPEEKRNGNEFMISVPDFISGEEINHSTEIDSLGRFSITFPLRGAQEYFADWRGNRLLRALVSKPGDTLFLFADMNDLIYSETDGDFWNNFMLKEKQILIMGDEARLNNELVQYKAPLVLFNRNDKTKSGIKGMEYLNKAKEAYETRMNYLNDYIANNPTVSDKFICYNTQRETYELAHNLMQRRFDLETDEQLEEDYITFVQENFSLTNPSVYILIRDFKAFIIDYIGYFKDKRVSYSVNPEMILDELTKKNALDDELKKHLVNLDNLIKQIETEPDTIKQQELIKEIEPAANYINSSQVVANTVKTMFDNYFFRMEFAKSDSLLANLPVLKELWDAYKFHQLFEKQRYILTEEQTEQLEKRITNPYLKQEIVNLNNHYAEIANKTINENSLKNTEYLGDIEDPEELLSKLVEPYKGNIIYLDFWGTWCQPCRQNMKLVGDIEKELQDKNVIFMYLANHSPLESWEQIIKEMNLTGEKIVHYRLPSNQQESIEKHLSVNSFPTYMLIDREGNLINKNAPSPMQRELLIKTIRELLSQ